MADRIYVVRSLVENTYDEYCKIYEATKDWEFKGNSGSEILAEVNKGEAQDAANIKFVAYLSEKVPEMQEAVLAMKNTLETEKETIKGLINMCDDFVETLRGNDHESLDVYKGYEPKTDILYFNDQYASQDAGYQGYINDNSRDVYFKSNTEKIKLEDAKSYLDQVATRDGLDLDISSQVETISECFTKQRYVIKLFSALKAYGAGVKECNENVKAGLDPYVDELGITQHRRSFRYEDEETENNPYIVTVMMNILDSYGVTPDDVEAAAKAGFSLKDLTEYYTLMESDEARDCFTHVLRGEYEEAFKNADYKIYDDASLMTALSRYSFSLIKVDENGRATKESNEQFAAFINGILSANKDNTKSGGDVSCEILKSLYAYSSVLAEAYGLAAACVDPSDPHFKDYILEADKRAAICNFYNSEYITLKAINDHSSLYHKGDDRLSDFKFSTTEISYSNSYGDGRSYPVTISALTTNDLRTCFDVGDACDELKEARAKLVGDFLTGTGKTLIGLSCPELGAAITLLSGIASGDSLAKDTKNSVDLMNKLLGGKYGDEATAIKISVDMVETLFKYAEANDDAARKVKQYLFGYEYTTGYDKSNFFMIFDGGTEKATSDNALSFYRPEGIVTMHNIEENGLLGIATPEQKKQYDDILSEMLKNGDKFEHGDMITKLLFGNNLKGEKLDFATVDYQELMDAIEELNRYGNSLYKDPITVEEVIRDEMNEIANGQAA